MNVSEIMVQLRDVAKQVKTAGQTKEYKKSMVVGKLINFTCQLEKLERVYKSQRLHEDIIWIKELIQQYEANTNYLLPEDLHKVNELYIQYKAQIHYL